MNKLNMMYRNLKTVYFYSFFINVILFFNCFNYAYSQGMGDLSIPKGLPNVLAPSPTVAALMRFEEVQVNAYNGTPDISIPISSLSAMGGINLNVNLSYHPSNINANQAASDCGLGWSLIAGGTISRTVKGMPDEILIPSNKIGIYHTSGSVTTKNLFYQVNNSVENNVQYNGANQQVTFKYMWDAIIIGNLDTEHDLYQYNFLGYSGRFIIKKNGNGLLEVVKFDQNPLKIVNIYNPTTFVPESFEITDDKGAKYIFNIAEITTTSQFTNANKPYGSGGDNPSGTTGFTYKSAFHLSKVYNSVNKLAVELIYTNDGKKEMNSTSSVTFAREKNDEMAYNAFVASNNASIGEFNPLPSRLLSTSQQTTLIRKLSKIKVIGQGRIDFAYTTGRQDTNLVGAGDTYKLSQIKLLTWKDSVQTKRFDFSYIYSMKIDNRMMLSSVKVYDKMNVFEYDYNLFYKSSNYELPQLGKDAWGYINQRPVNMTYGAYQETTPEHCTNDVLEVMKIPSGGAVKYNFESNTYSHIGNQTITNFDENPDNWIHEMTLKSFNIVNNNTTAFFSIYGNDIQDVWFQTDNDFMQSGITEWRFKIYRVVNGVNVDVATLWNTTELRVKNMVPGNYMVSFDLAGQVLNPPLTFIARIKAFHKRKPIGTQQNPVIVKQFLYGGGIRIKNIQYYTNFNMNDIMNSSFVPDKETNYNYAFFNNSSHSSGSLVYHKPVFNYEKVKRECLRGYGSFLNLPVSWSDYSMFYDITTTTNNLATIKTKGSDVGYKNVTVTETDNGSKRLTYSTAIDYPEVIELYTLAYPFIPTTNIDYKRGNLLVSETFDNENRILEKIENTYTFTDEGFLQTGLRIFYPQDLQFINYFQHTDYDDYLEHVANCNPQIPEEDCFCLSGLPETFISISALKEAYGTANLSSSISKQYFYTDNSLIPKIVNSTTSYTYDPYNKKISSQETTTGLGDVLLTEYKYAKNLLTEPNASTLVSKNMLSLPLKITRFRNSEKIEEDKIIYKNWSNTIIAPEFIQSVKGSHPLEAKVKYNRYDEYGNVLEVQQENGMKISYVWGYSHTQPVAKLENMAYASIPSQLISNIHSATTESGLENALNALRASLTTAMVTTYTYIPLVGISTVTDPKGATTTYTYDSFGRLSAVRDSDNKLLTTHTYNYRP